MRWREALAIFDQRETSCRGQRRDFSHPFDKHTRCAGLSQMFRSLERIVGVLERK